MLYLVGLGLDPACKDLTLKGIESLKISEEIYAENYTADIFYDFSFLQSICEKKIIALSREEVEVENFLIKQAKNKTISFLVPGDPLFATTHKEIIVECIKSGIEWKVVNAPSILTVCGKTGLSLYKFGRVVSIPFVDESGKYLPITPYIFLKKNFENTLHTLVLLDIGMTPNQAIEILEKMEIKAENRFKSKFFKNKMVFVCSRLNHKDERIIYGEVEKIMLFEFGRGPHCLIFPAEMEFHEEEFIKVVFNERAKS